MCVFMRYKFYRSSIAYGISVSIVTRRRAHDRRSPKAAARHLDVALSPCNLGRFYSPFAVVCLSHFDFPSGNEYIDPRLNYNARAALPIMRRARARRLRLFRTIARRSRVNSDRGGGRSALQNHHR